jgi:protein phosphatase methylesterase 1
LKEIKERFTWRIDLTKTEKYWTGWFKGLSKLYLNIPQPKLLLLAGVDRLDKELMVGQMQGRFQMQILPQCGHAVHEGNLAIKRHQVPIILFKINRFTR